MNLLIDTHVFLWLAVNLSLVSTHARMLLEAKENSIFLSSISVWEIEQKFRLGKLTLPLSPRALIAEFYQTYGIHPLPFNEEAAFMLEKLPPLHGDPFDRMLICQTIQHGMTFITADKRLHQYPINVAW